MIKRVALINPNFFLRDKFDFVDLTYPLGLAYIAVVLEKNGFTVNIIDANALNLTKDQIVESLIKFKPDIVGISCNFSPLHNPTLEIANSLKENINVPVVVGGNHVCALKEVFINHKNIDFVVLKEAEYVFLELVRSLDTGRDLNLVQGILFKKGEEIVQTQRPPLIDDLDKLPMPAYHLLPMHLYERYSIITSRGCPFNCSYCASKVVFDNKVRFRSPENVLSEITYLINTYGRKVIWFCDDTFTTDERYVLRLCSLIKEKGLNFAWRCHTHVAKISERMLREMKKAGCFCIVYGIESGSQKILKKMRKAMTREQVIDGIKKTKNAGIDAAAFFMVGMPGEDLESIMDSYRLIYESRPTAVSFCITLPLPGTQLFRELAVQKKIQLEDLKWDYFFARIPGHREEEHYAANLASKWCGITSETLIRACILGDKIAHLEGEFNLSEIKKQLGG